MEDIFNKLRKETPGRNNQREYKNMFFYTLNLAGVEKDIRERLAEIQEKRVSKELFAIKPWYGSSPDKMTMLQLIPSQCPSIYIKEVPEDWEMYPAFWAQCAANLGLDPTKHLAYKGQSKSSVCEEMRIAIMRTRIRMKLTENERSTLKNKNGGRCAICGSMREAPLGH